MFSIPCLSNPLFQRNACVEVPCLVDRNGVQPTYIGDLPEQCAALNRTNINVQLLAAQVQLTRRDAEQAVPAASRPEGFCSCRNSQWKCNKTCSLFQAAFSIFSQGQKTSFSAWSVPSAGPWKNDADSLSGPSIYSNPMGSTGFSLPADQDRLFRRPTCSSEGKGI